MYVFVWCVCVCVRVCMGNIGNTVNFSMILNFYSKIIFLLKFYSSGILLSGTYCRGRVLLEGVGIFQIFLWGGGHNELRVV